MRRAALAAVFALAALAAAVALSTEPAPAHHDQGVSGKPGRSPLCYMKPDPDNINAPGVPADGSDCVTAVARNLVGDVGGSASAAIRVCAGTDYDASTKEAIRLLNGTATGGFGRALFAWGGGLSNCSHELTSGRVSSIAVTADDFSGGGRCGATAWACAGHFTVRAAPHYGYVGRAEVKVNPRLDVVNPAGALYGACPAAGSTLPDPRLSSVQPCTDATAGNLQPGRADGTLELTRHIAHELMHVVGLPDYYCGTASLNPTRALGTTRALMDSAFGEDCRSPLLATAAARKAGTAALATIWDRADYTALYTASAVTRLQAVEAGTPGREQLQLRWTAGHVHVERGFAVERWTGSAWERVPGALAKANAASVTIAMPSSLTTYRVVTLTDALGTAATAKSSASVTYTPKATTRTVTRSATATSTVNQKDANTKAEKAARAALVAAYPKVTGVTVTAGALPESTETDKATGSGTGATKPAASSEALKNARANVPAGAKVTAARVTGTTPPGTVTRTGRGTGSGTGATKGAAESAARTAATAAARAAGGSRATIAPATITGTTPPSTVTRTGRGTGSGTGATKGAAESAARTAATAAARAAGGSRATIAPATITGTTPPKTVTRTGIGTGSGSGATKGAAESAARSSATAAARAAGGARATIAPATITGTTPPKTGTARGSGAGATEQAAASDALSAARAARPSGATVTGTSVSTTPRYGTGTTTVSASYTADTATDAWLGCAGRLLSAARAVNGYVSHSGGCSVRAGIGAEGETIYTGSGTATVTWRLLRGWSATATASWRLGEWSATATASWSRTDTIGEWSATAAASWSRTDTTGEWSATAAADWSRTDTTGEWSATAEASWSRTTYSARGTATGTVPR